MRRVRTIQNSGNEDHNQPNVEDSTFRLLAENAASTIFIFEGERILYVNPAGEKLSGYSLSELRQMTLTQLAHPDFQALVTERLKRRSRNEVESARYEFKLITKSGEERWVDVSASQIPFHGKTVSTGTAIDITEHKRSEQIQEAVYRIVQAADQAETLDKLFPVLHEIIGEVMNAKNFYIALYDEESELLSFPYFVDEADEQPAPAPLGKGMTEYVLRTGKPILADSGKIEKMRNKGLVEDMGAPSPIWLGVPLSVSDKTIGVMVVQDYADPLAYGEREKRILEFVSSQVAVVINRKRTEEDLRKSEERYHKRADELAALYDTTRDLSTQRDLKMLLNMLVDRVTLLLGSPGCTIYLYDPGLDQLKAVVAKGGENIVGTVLGMGEGVAGRVARTLQPISLRDHRKWEHRSPKFEDLRATSLAEVPMLYSGELLGVLSVFELEQPGQNTIREFTETDLNLLAVFAGTAASAVHNARLFEETRQRLLELEVLYQASLASAQIHSLNAVAQRVIETLEQLMNWKRGSIWVVDEERNKPVLLARNNGNLSGEALKEELARVDALVPDLNHGIIGWVCTHGKPVRTNDVSHEPNYVESIPGTKAELCVPLRIGGRTIGCINVESSGDSVFTEHDERLLSTLAGQTTVAIENARLYQEALLSAERRSVLYQAGQEIARTSQDPEQVYAAVHRATTQLMPCDAFVITLSDEIKQEINGVYLFDRGVRHPNNIMKYGEGISGRVISTGKSIHVRDFDEEDQGITPHVFGREGRTRSVLAVPMRSGEKTIGMISVQNYQPNVYKDEDLVLLETLAANAGVAIDNARLFEDTRARAVRQAALNTIIMAATRAGTDLDALLNMALDHTLRALRLDLGGLWLSWHMRGIPRSAVRGVLSMDVPTVVKSLDAVSVDLLHTDVVTDWTTDKRVIAQRLIQLGVGSSIIVPMLSDGLRIGGVAVGSGRRRDWSVDEISLVEAVGREVGAAVERAKLFEETHMRMVELEGVNRVSIALRQASSIGDMLPALMNETLNTLDAVTGGIWLFDQTSGKLKQVIGRGWCQAFAEVELERDESIPGKVFATGDIYYSHDVRADPVTDIRSWGSTPEGWSAVCVPILAEQEIIGALFISVQLPREIDPNSARLLVTLAEMAGNAIHRMVLHERTEHHAAELETRVTERTAELQTALVKAQESDRLKTEFIANVNHELRTPLTNLILYYQMLRSQPTIRTEERLDVIGRELQRLRQLIEDLLNLSRMDQGQVSIRMNPGNLNTLVQTLVNDRRSLADEKNLTLTAELSPALPEFMFDEKLISQAVSNLLTNALHYTPNGGHVCVRTVLSDDQVALSVVDDGPGIDAEDMARIFDRFFRGKVGQQSGSPGTGLGLAIVKQVVVRHNGTIEVDHNGLDGRGANFTIRLPLKPQQETA